ncbi:hypothetical protein [Paenibacillus tyrfis]|uniref:hypothetical protein n=1 Tax=Paenibacillus tyrfis TaxID=1501230 RepID=UPI00209F8D72|nr:hypothetical protein [Paenibacillus tyrfis]MCP1309842.1 hypothetical protein [Paenibacillus tyrfis]
MGGKIVISVFLFFMMAWGFFAVFRPEFNLKYNLGNFKGVKPTKFLLLNSRLSGAATFLLSVYILYRVWSG